MKRILLVCLLVCLLASASFSQDAPTKRVVKTDVSPSAPRYQLFASPESRRDTFLLDTFTGKIWRMRMAVEDTYYWKAEERVDDVGQEVAWYKTHLTKDQLKQVLEAPK